MEKNNSQQDKKDTSNIQNVISANEKRKKFLMFSKTFSSMIIVLFIVFGYVNQSAKQVYLNYEIVKLNKQIDNLNIKLREAQIENESLKTNENVEKLAVEKLGMTYASSDKVVIVKESSQQSANGDNGDKKKIEIFMNSLYEDAYNNLRSLNASSVSKFFIIK